MESDKSRKIVSALLFAVGTLLSWGGMLYATNDPEHFRMIGVLVSFVGYGIFFTAAMIYERITE